MNRRAFLTRALASVPVVLAGAELADHLADLLVPRKSIFLPPRGGWVVVAAPWSDYLKSKLIAEANRVGATHLVWYDNHIREVSGAEYSRVSANEFEGWLSNQPKVFVS